MKLKICVVGIILALLYCIVPLQGAYANGNKHHGRGHHKYYKHYRYYPHTYYYYKKIYYFPLKRHYYYYDVLPENIYYYQAEKDTLQTNPDYLSIVSIANMGSQGVPDAVIIAEIERTRSTYKLNSEIITYLKQNSVGEGVIDFMLKTGEKR